MSHDYHQGAEDAILYDGCAECDARAKNPMVGLLNLDEERFETLWRRMLAVEDNDSTYYRSGNEAALGKHLNYVRILIERHAGAMR